MKLIECIEFGFLAYGLGVLGGFCIALVGIEQIDGKRHRLGIALIAAAVIAELAGTAIFLSSMARI